MKRLPAILLCLLFLVTPAQACIWDRDTLAMERARFPEVNELIVGYFPRHSSAYYQWRQKQVLAIPVDQRSPSDYDDLAVSYDKLGEHDQAIATMLAKVKRFPNEAVYETHANLGTFYIHHGDLEQGAQYIGSAIEINPEAHFGREVYQKLLVEYVLATRALGHALPLEQEIKDSLEYLYSRFDRYVLDALGFSEADYQTQQSELKKAITGVLGMMRFGSHDSPILLEALGDLLDAQDSETGSQRLAARAFLKAAYETDDPVAVARYREKARSALISQQSVTLAGVEARLKEEIAKGDDYFAEIEADEKAWIAAGKDVDAQFKRAYYDEAPELRQSLAASATDRLNSLPFGVHVQIVAWVVGLICLVSTIILVRRVLRLRRTRREIAAKLQQA